MSNSIKIGIEKYDATFCVPFDDNITLEQFHDALEKIVGLCKLNIAEYEKKKNKKLKEVFKGNNYIYCIKNENLGSIIKKWKGNFINQKNSCFRDSFIQCIIHSMVEKIVKKEEEWRKKNGLSTAQNSIDYNNSNNDSLWNDLLELSKKFNQKIKNNDSSPLLNSYDPLNFPEDQKYQTGEKYVPEHLGDYPIHPLEQVRV